MNHWECYGSVMMSAGPEANFYKTRATTNAHGLVSNNDAIGTLNFRGSDGSSYIRCALIEAAIDGTPGTNDMPGRLVFSTTADGASSPTERMRIDSSGRWDWIRRVLRSA